MPIGPGKYSVVIDLAAGALWRGQPYFVLTSYSFGLPGSLVLNPGSMASGSGSLDSGSGSFRGFSGSTGGLTYFISSNSQVPFRLPGTRSHCAPGSRKSGAEGVASGGFEGAEKCVRGPG